jgi:RNA polymerase sigma-70 factor (ECF subfamily)
MLANKNPLEIKEVFLAVAKGRPEAFESFFELYKAKVYEVAYRMTKSADIAKDLSQNFFMDFWQNREKLSAVNEPGAYIHTSIYHLALRYLRLKGYEERYLDLVKLGTKNYSNDTEERIDLRQLQELLNLAIGQLPSIKATVFKMRYHEKMEYELIAADLGITLSTARSYFSDAIRSIREFVKQNHLLDPKLYAAALVVVQALEHASVTW